MSASMPTVRLSVNLGPTVAAELRRVAEANAWTITEAIRRAISTWVYVEDQQAQGNRIGLFSADGSTVREVLFR